MNTRLDTPVAVVEADDHREADVREILDRWEAQVPDSAGFMLTLASRTGLVDDILALFTTAGA